MANRLVVQEAMRLSAHKKGSEIKENLIAAGWKRLGNGAFKVAYGKDDVVAKIGKDYDFSMNDSEGPLEWLTAYSSTPEHLRHYLAKVLAVGQNVLVMEKAPNADGHTCGKERCESARKLLVAAWKRQGHRWTLFDGSHNHGHRSDGSPVWYDGL